MIRLHKILVTQYCYPEKTFYATKHQIFIFFKKKTGKKNPFILEYFKHVENVERLVY